MISVYLLLDGQGSPCPVLPEETFLVAGGRGTETTVLLF